MQENYRIGTTLTKQQWINVLRNEEITKEIDILILQIIYSFEGHESYASRIGLTLGFKGKNLSSPINLEIGRWGKRLVKIYPVRYTIREDGSERKWDIFFDGRTDGKFFIWKLKNELKEAIEDENLSGESHLPEELLSDNQQKIIEGAKKTITVNSYERNSRARSICINFYGKICSVCGFDFRKTYGEIGKDFIHVHHLKRISEIGNEYEIDPIKDLRPVCPNCHAMLHKKEPPLAIEDLKKIVDENK